MRRPFIVIVMLACLCSIAGSQGLRIAVMDFTVESDNPQYKYLGKGFAELASIEVAKLPGFVLVDRERRNALLEEQAFALSGAADLDSAMAIGKLLTVDYLVVGSILDMFGNLVVTYSVIRTDTGEVVGKQSAEGAPGEYKRIVRDIGTGIAGMCGKEAAVRVAQAAPPPPPPAEKQAEVLSSFSDAVAALDRKDVKAAAASLAIAQRIDPTDAAVQLYIDKLGGGTSKFAVIPAVYFSLDNPASFGSLDRDMAYVYGAMGSMEPFGQYNAEIQYPMVDLEGLYGADAAGAGGVAATYSVRELDGRFFAGYALPLGAGFGLCVQGYFAHVEDNVARKDSTIPSSAGWNSIDFSGGLVSLGWAPTSWLSVGLSATAGPIGGWVRDSSSQAMQNSSDFIYGGEFGLILKNPEGSLVVSLVTGTSSYTVRFFDMETVTLTKSYQWPIYIDMSVAYGFNGMHDFVILKYIVDIYGFPGNSGGSAPAMQLIPAYEHSFGDIVSARLGAVVSISPHDTLYIGYGASLGATVNLGNLELDLSATYRQRPSRVYNRENIPEALFSVGLRYRGIFFGGM